MAASFSRRASKRKTLAWTAKDREPSNGLRQAYIRLRLVEYAIYQIAQSCRTGVEMIEKYCAAHNIKDAARRCSDQRHGHAAPKKAGRPPTQQLRLRPSFQIAKLLCTFPLRAL